MAKIKFNMIDWGPTIMLGLIRTWLSGIIFIILCLIINPSEDMTLETLIVGVVFYPVIALFLGGVFYLVSLIPMAGLLARIIWFFLFCLGDPIVYIINRNTDIFKKAQLKIVNFEIILLVLKNEE